ncbi:tryptophan--tRNA ligase [Flavobacteriaceae bacterium]|jgi:tryptophanyl-tRNA synthetase|nr:tryptophan--tRNA ligase [Flavobacteriaceae bacterium]MDB2426413.1 tryptophan--tRNA ligase [Flavobacteriaceae bacterium]MDC3198546.1 tryptophan--tRNA ligase [Flavobacteriaceae bacterium]MDC3350344.1 tryptophan--tRNA ligase [Flavobacteriaceae bacterium]
MARILTGVQSTGTPHLGNILGAIIPAIKMSNDPENESYLFIADMHSLTQIKDADKLSQNTYATAATWLAFGLNIENTVFYKQSSVSQVTELSWYLSCFFPFSRLELAHSFKDKSDHLEDVNGGLFTYPMLMAADILLYDANIIPVGKDQLQHIEMTRDVASRVHAKVGEIFVIPEGKVQKENMLVSGTDGQKMSKSKGNVIDIFQTDKALRKQIMSIQTDSTALEAPKKWSTCNSFAIYKLLASDSEIAQMKQNYEAGGYGYGHAKQALFELICNKFSEQRKRYAYYMNNLEEIDQALEFGAKKAALTANAVLKRVRKKIGY